MSRSSSEIFTRLGISEADIMRQSQSKALGSLLPDITAIVLLAQQANIDEAQIKMDRLRKDLQKRIGRKP